MGPEQNYGYNAPVYAPVADPNKKKRIIIGGGLLVIFIFIVLAIVVAIFSKPGASDDVFKIAAMHTEISRISELGLESDRARRATQNLAANVSSVSTNNLFLLKQYADKNISKPLTKLELGAEKNTSIDKALEDAGLANSYDEKFSEIISQLLSQTNTEIVSAFEKTGDAKLKDVLNEIGTNNKAIIDGIAETAN